MYVEIKNLWRNDLIIILLIKFLIINIDEKKGTDIYFARKKIFLNDCELISKRIALAWS